MGLSKSAIDKLRLPNKPRESKSQSSAEERFYHAGDQLGFDWDNDLRPVFSSWKSVRDSLAHGNIAEFKQTNGDEMLEAYRRVIVAFNAISLRLIGYRGDIELKNHWYPVPS
jgi:hypothetical protein